MTSRLRGEPWGSTRELTHDERLLCRYAARVKFHRCAALLAGLASCFQLACSDSDVPVPCAGAACGSVAFSGLSAEVRVLRDTMGVVHIYGDTDTDVMYGAGYAQAVDRKSVV